MVSLPIYTGLIGPLGNVLQSSCSPRDHLFQSNLSILLKVNGPPFISPKSLNLGVDVLSDSSTHWIYIHVKMTVVLSLTKSTSTIYITNDNMNYIASCGCRKIEA